jgi:hypothetical protein
MPNILKKNIVRIVSTNPRKKTGYAKAPMAKADTTKFAESH